MIDLRELITHPFGNFVIQHILKYGTTEDRQMIVKYLVMDIYNLSRHRVASQVIESAFVHGCPDDKTLLKEVLSSLPSELALLGQSHFGSAVVREMLRVQTGMPLECGTPCVFLGSG